MIHGAKSMACGNCGNGTFTIHTDDKTARLLVECTECKSVSVVSVSKPQITIGWGDTIGAPCDGILCSMEPKKRKGRRR